MTINLEQLGKLRGRSFRELRVRGGQEVAKLRDRLVQAHAPEMSDDELLREFAPDARDGSGEGTADLLRHRLRSKRKLFLPSIEQRKIIVETMNRRFQPERDAIIANAEKALSGQFDLLGLTGLDFGNPQGSAIDWHLDPVSGKRAPMVHWSRLDALDPLGGGDVKVVWELNRHAHFVTLGQAYWLTDDDRFAEGFVNQACEWIDANPVGMGINWAASLEVAFRAIAWLWALHLCADSREVSPDFVARLIKSLIEHGRHIEKYLSTYFSPNTHLTGEALGLFYLGVALPELRRAERWRKIGLQILLEQLPIHVRKDGVYFEQSSYYHRYTTDFYTHLFAMARANDITIERDAERMLWQRLELLLDHLMWITRPDGTSPLFGDDDGGRLIKFAPRVGNDFRDTLGIGAAIFKRGDWKHVVGAAPVEMLWMLGTEGLACYDRITAEPQRELSRAFDSSGYFVMRDGWSRDSGYALIDCGRHGSELGAGHAHADALSIEFASQGTTWIVDPGTYIYASDVRSRDEFRSSEAHNTVTIDGQPQSAPGAPFAWRTMTNCSAGELTEINGGYSFSGSHDGYERLSDPVTHKRSVTFIKAGERQNLPAHLIVRDQFNARKRHHYAIRYHLTSACTAIAGEHFVEAREASGRALTISLHGETAVRTRVVESAVSKCYRQRESALVAIFEAEASGPQEFLTFILPGTYEQAAAVRRQLAEDWRNTNEGT
jgi:hypothetical protein